MFRQHLTRFAGLTVTRWEKGQPLGDLTRTMHRLSVDYDSQADWVDILEDYLAAPGAEQTRGLSVGAWHGEVAMGEPPDRAVAALAAAAGRLPYLQVLFFGDIVTEESEVSWIVNTDLEPIARAHPRLTHLAIRGGIHLRLPGLVLPELVSLVIETAGMSGELVRDVMAAQLPSLRHLELYLGTEDHGASVTLADLHPILSASVFASLRYLGVKNSEIQDEIAVALAHSPVLSRIEALDLSLGVLTDIGGSALAGSPGVQGLRWLDLHHHFLTPPVQEQLAGLGIPVDLADGQDPAEDWKFVAIGE